MGLGQVVCKSEGDTVSLYKRWHCFRNKIVRCLITQQFQSTIRPVLEAR